MDLSSFTLNQGGGIRGRIAFIVQAKRFHARPDTKRTRSTCQTFRTGVECSTEVSLGLAHETISTCTDRASL